MLIKDYVCCFAQVSARSSEPKNLSKNGVGDFNDSPSSTCSINGGEYHERRSSFIQAKQKFREAAAEDNEFDSDFAETESETEYESMDAQDDDSDETDDEDVNEDDCDESSEVMTIIGVHELHGRMHPN